MLKVLEKISFIDANDKDKIININNFVTDMKKMDVTKEDISLFWEMFINMSINFNEHMETKDKENIEKVRLWVSKNVHLQKEILELQSIITSKDNNIDQFLLDKKNKIDELTDTISQLSAKNMGLEDLHIQEINKNKLLQEECLAIKKKNNNQIVKLEMDKLSEKNKILENEINSLTTANKTLKTNLETIKNKNLTLKSTIEQVQYSNNTLETQLDKTNSDLKILKTELDKINDENKILRTNSNKGCVTNKALKLDFDKLKTENDTLKLDFGKLIAENDTLKLESGKLIPEKVLIMDDKEIKSDSSSIETSQYTDNSISSTSTNSNNSATKKKNKRNKKIVDNEKIHLQQGQQLIYVPVAINSQYLNSCVPYSIYYPNNY